MKKWSSTKKYEPAVDDEHENMSDNQVWLPVKLKDIRLLPTGKF